MKLHLTTKVKIRDIQKEFKNSFPYLKLEFMRRKQGKEKTSPRADIIPSNANFVSIAGGMKEEEMEIKPNQTVAELEQIFQSGFNLPVQVFRKTRSSWVETNKTNQQSLIKQNVMGREDCNAMYEKDVLL